MDERVLGIVWKSIYPKEHNPEILINIILPWSRFGAFLTT